MGTERGTDPKDCAVKSCPPCLAPPPRSASPAPWRFPLHFPDRPSLAQRCPILRPPQHCPLLVQVPTEQKEALSPPLCRLPCRNCRPPMGPPRPTLLSLRPLPRTFPTLSTNRPSLAVPAPSLPNPPGPAQPCFVLAPSISPSLSSWVTPTCCRLQGPPPLLHTGPRSLCIPSRTPRCPTPSLPS